jgi:hypothetical protein
MQQLCSYINHLSCIGFLFLISTTACKKTNSQNGPTAVVYVAGSIPGTNESIPAYWKNGVSYTLSGPNPSGAATVMTIAGTDIYLAGYSFTNPANTFVTYWKNGVASVLQNYVVNGSATGIAVSDTDVYITGYSYSLNGAPVPAYWKNGTVDTLPLTGSGAQTMAITLSGADVYVVGNDVDFQKAMVWKNGVMTSLGVGYAEAIAVADTNVYVAGDSYPPSGGSSDYIAAIWINGLTTPLGYTSSIYYAGHASAIAIFGNDVYVAGYTYDQNGSGTTVATYWKNGSPVQLEFGMANAICVSGVDVYVAGN